MKKAKAITFFGAPWYGLAGLLAFRLWFSAVLPMTGDEAYFVLWGEHPAGGYYDHPPMVGWWMSALLALSRAEWALRLPSALLPVLLAWGGWHLARPWGDARANLAAWLVLLQPANVWNVLITTDTPVVLFSLLSMLAYVTALRCAARRTYRAIGANGAAIAWQAVAGGLLGLAFLGKYFAALLGVAYAFHIVFRRRDRGRWLGFLAILAAALPAPIYNLWWNSGHCWANLLFNFINRQTNVGLNLISPALYLVSVLYLATPWVIWVIWRQRRALQAVCTLDGVADARDVPDAADAKGAPFWLALAPLVIFAAMSLFRKVGLHWLLAFMPLLAVLAALIAPDAGKRRLLRWSAAFAGLHMLVFAAIMLAPLQLWQKTKWYDGMVLAARSDALLERLAPYAHEYLFATDGYSSAATLAYHAGRHFAVFGEGSVYARQDDFVTDWRAQQGRNVLILRKSAPPPEDYAPYFRQVTVHDFTVLGARYWMVLGQGFDYPAYHSRVLRRIHERFYRIPEWLPTRGCDFCARYFPDEAGCRQSGR